MNSLCQFVLKLIDVLDNTQNLFCLTELVWKYNAFFFNVDEKKIINKLYLNIYHILLFRYWYICRAARMCQSLAKAHKRIKLIQTYAVI